MIYTYGAMIKTTTAAVMMTVIKKGASGDTSSDVSAVASTLALRLVDRHSRLSIANAFFVYKVWTLSLLLASSTASSPFKHCTLSLSLPSHRSAAPSSPSVRCLLT